MAISERRRLTFTAIAVILVGLITGFLLGNVLSGGAPPSKTFNIVNYHWGFALYDEDWKEIERMEVARGTRVSLVAFPAEVLSPELRESLEARVVAKGFGAYSPGDTGIYELIQAARAKSAEINHGGLIAPLNIDLRPKGEAASLAEAIDSIEFTTDAIGSFDIVCSVYCGLGHPDMSLKGALVVK